MWARDPPWGDFGRVRGQNFGLDSQHSDHGLVGSPQERPRKKLKGLVAEIFKPCFSVPGFWVSCLGYLCLIILFGRSWLIILEKEMATHSSTFARKIPWMEEPSRL